MKISPSEVSSENQSTHQKYIFFKKNKSFLQISHMVDRWNDKELSAL